jgi:hypothetical protein
MSKIVSIYLSAILQLIPTKFHDLDEGKAPFDISKHRSERLPVSNLLDETPPRRTGRPRHSHSWMLELLNSPAERAKIPKG